MFHTLGEELLVYLYPVSKLRMFPDEAFNLVEEVHGDKVGQAPQMSLHADVDGREVQFDLVSTHLPFFKSMLLTLEECLFEIHPLVIADFPLA